MREEIRATLAAERAASLAASKASELAARARREKPVSGEALGTMAAGETGVSFRTAEPFGRDDLVPGIGRATAFTVTAFELEPGEISEPVQVTDGWAVLRLDEIVPPRLPELAEVRDRVEQAVRARAQRLAAVRRLEEAKQALAAGSSLDEIAAELEVEIQQTGLFGRDGRIAGLGRQPALAEAALALDEGAVGGPVEVGQSAVLFEVSERQRFDPATFAEAREETRASLEEERFRLLLTSLIERRRNEVKVELKPAFIQNFQLATDST